LKTDGDFPASINERIDTSTPILNSRNA